MNLIFLLLTSLLTVCSASRHSPGHSSPLRPRSNLTDCQDVLDNGLSSPCYDTLDIDAWIKNWNLTTKTCQPNELWANCFMREIGVPAESGLGCAQVGPNTCNEPTADLVATASTEQIYTAVSIWALQQFYTALYVDITGDNGTEYISSAWSNLTDVGVTITSKSLLACILNSDPDPRTQMLGLMVMTNIPVPGLDDSVIPNQTAAPKALGSALAAYLLTSMTDFVGGGYWGMAKNGKLLV